MVTMTVSCHNQQQTFIVFVLLCRHSIIVCFIYAMYFNGQQHKYIPDS